MKTFKMLALVAALSFAAVSAADARGGGHGSGSHSSASSSRSRSASGDHYVPGYVRKDGTVVQGYYATNPNGTRNDNYSTRGNVNPYTGEPGTKPRDGEGPK